MTTHQEKGEKHKVGDVVPFGRDLPPVTIIAISGVWLMVRREKARPFVISLQDLEAN